ncbi:hypothetical protein CLV24_13044 [Pontibacter ummariensis]|uniref:Lipocalin-like domain-containing protein n=1 Tax=Pontibacter ummariensis TaxID=1610492 RepID=A0A239KNC3_9BACT|nr:hypothetical protein CLV24_13044 [Pontibacter ummariensis]SNT19887.1 hypothetical protein SAMN06296052_13044 [Pontibacter ummariensis]
MPFLLILFLSACKEDEEVEPSVPFPNDNLPIKEQLQGRWINHLRIDNFYNLEGEVIRTDSAGVGVIHEFKGNKMDISYANGERVASLMYSLPDTSTAEKDYIVFLKDGKVQDYYQITTLNDTSMVWELTVDWAGYVDENGDTITTRKGVYTYEFKRD